MSFELGDRVSLQIPLAYLKTSDPMPMLRPSDLVSLDEIGTVIGIRTVDLIEVKFRRGSFLIPINHLAIVNKE